jgi:hypothetical protein
VAAGSDVTSFGPSALDRRIDRVVSNVPSLLPGVARHLPGTLTPRVERPVFLLGCGRSGKTVLAGVLGRHPDIALFPDEANFLWHPRLYPWRDSELRDRVPPIWVDPRAFTGGSLGARDSHDVDALRSTFGLYQRIRRRPILLNESALLAFMIPFLEHNFDRPVIVHLVRDGRAAASAWARRQHAAIERRRDPYRAAGYDLSFDEVLDHCAASWDQQVREVRRRVDESRGSGHPVVEYRYEDFCADPGGVLAAICARLEIDPAPVLATDLRHIENRNRVDIGNLPADALARMETIMAQGLGMHGYA